MAHFEITVCPDTPEHAREFFHTLCGSIAALEELFRSAENGVTLSGLACEGLADVLYS